MSNVTWRILSDYHTFGLRDAVKMEQNRLRKCLRIKNQAAHRMALIIVRTALVSAIDKGQYHG
jgi:hypothetical protein